MNEALALPYLCDPEEDESPWEEISMFIQLKA